MLPLTTQARAVLVAAAVVLGVVVNGGWCSGGGGGSGIRPHREVERVAGSARAKNLSPAICAAALWAALADYYDDFGGSGVGWSSSLSKTEQSNLSSAPSLVVFSTQRHMVSGLLAALPNQAPPLRATTTTASAIIERRGRGSESTSPRGHLGSSPLGAVQSSPNFVSIVSGRDLARWMSRNADLKKGTTPASSLWGASTS
mmetsp:Transcript_15232/g.25892  ORF Transcript_15232/g.25892 Transcript_15232/m.25892 type:complete len:201 (+) Transcript_15232:248-850(+)